MDALKEKLPEMLEEIQHCKEMAAAHLMMYRMMIAQCVRETVDPDYISDYWTTKEALEETYSNYEEAVARQKHLEWVIKNIKNFAKSA